MKEEIYENIIKNSKIAYIKINCIKDNDNKYIIANVIEQSKELEKLIKKISNNNFFNKESIEVIIDNWIKNTLKSDGFDELIRNTINKGYSRIEYSKQFNGKKLIIDIYYLEKYFILVCNIEDKHEETKEKIKIYNWTKDLNGIYLDAYTNYNDSSKMGKNNWIIGKKDIDLWKYKEVKIYRENEAEVISKNKMRTFYEIMTNRNDEKVYMESTLWPLLDDNNIIIGTRGSSIKIDDKIALEKNITQNEEAFKEITKYCESVFIIKDKNRATYVSPAYENIFESESKELYNDINKLYEYFKRLKEENKDIIDDFEIDLCNEGIGKVRLDNNKEKYIWYKFLPIKNEKCEVTKRVGILTDITDKQKLEEEKNQLKLDFFANISHELRTPINLISSTIQLIKMNLNKLPEEEAQKLYKYIDIMEVNSFRLIRLINNLIDTSKIDAGFIDFNPANLDIVSYVEDICDSIIEFVKYNDMNLVFDTNSEKEMVEFDPEMMERIILNILSNAIKFNKPKGVIYVTLSILDNDVEISIKDEGIGIPKEKLDKIFQRFEQVNPREKIEKQGSGIGLYLVKTLIELHGGSVVINSEVNKGSEFIVSIPRKVLNKDDNITLTNNKINSTHTKVEFSDI